jgi:hypothetical protein
MRLRPKRTIYSEGPLADMTARCGWLLHGFLRVLLAGDRHPAFRDGRIHNPADQLAVPTGASRQPGRIQGGLDLAIARGWLWLHESGTYVKFTQAGSELFV